MRITAKDDVCKKTGSGGVYCGIVAVCVLALAPFSGCRKPEPDKLAAQAKYATQGTCKENEELCMKRMLDTIRCVVDFGGVFAELVLKDGARLHSNNRLQDGTRIVVSSTGPAHSTTVTLINGKGMEASDAVPRCAEPVAEEPALAE